MEAVNTPLPNPKCVKKGILIDCTYWLLYLGKRCFYNYRCKISKVPEWNFLSQFDKIF